MFYFNVSDGLFKISNFLFLLLDICLSLGDVWRECSSSLLVGVVVFPSHHFQVVLSFFQVLPLGGHLLIKARYGRKGR